MRKYVTALFIIALTFSACTQGIQEDTTETTPVVATEIESVPEPVTEPEPKPTIPQEEPMTKETTTPEPVIVPTITLAPIPEYPAYILDQCGTLWGIPASLQGEYHKERIEVTTDTGTPIPSSELDFFTLDGVIFITHHYTATDSAGKPADAIDYYRQERGEMERVESIPQKPEVTRVSLDGAKWKIETSIINGVEFSYLYNLDEGMVQEMGNYGGKGARMGAWGQVTGYAELDRGMLIMTNDGALFFPINRACGNAVGEKGRLWK